MMFRNNNPGDITISMPSGLAIPIAALLMLLVFTASAQAAQIHVETDRNNIAADENFQIIFSVEGEVDAAPDFSPLEKDFELLGTSQSRNISIINGKTSRTTRYLVNVLARRSGELTIPPISFGTDKSPAAKISVKDSGMAVDPATGVADASVFLGVSVDENTPYVQQQVILTVRIFSSIQWREAGLSEPGFVGGEMLVQKLGEDRSYQKQLDGKNWRVIERRYALFPQQSGEIKMQPLRLSLRIPAGRKQRRSPGGGGFSDPFFNGFLSGQSFRNKVVRSEALTLQVEPAPAGFSGSQWLIGKELRLEESWSDDLAALKTGEPVTRTVAIIADGVTLGQLPDISMPDLDGLRIYPDDPLTHEQASGNGVLSTSSRKFAVIPVRPGSYQIPAFELKWWNSKTGKEETARIAPQTIEVTGVAPVPVPGTIDSATAEGVDEHNMESRETIQISSPSPTRSQGSMNRWILAGAVVFLFLWLITLFALIRSRRGEAGDALEGSRELPVEIHAGEAWKALHASATAEAADRLREALLQLAPVIWKKKPPRSLEAMAELVGQPLSAELLELSRELYAGKKGAWNGQLIEREMKVLAKHCVHDKKGRNGSALRPMYPEPLH